MMTNNVFINHRLLFIVSALAAVRWLWKNHLEFWMKCHLQHKLIKMLHFRQRDSEQHYYNCIPIDVANQNWLLPDRPQGFFGGSVSSLFSSRVYNPRFVSDLGSFRFGRFFHRGGGEGGGEGSRPSRGSGRSAHWRPGALRRGPPSIKGSESFFDTVSMNRWKGHPPYCRIRTRRVLCGDRVKRRRGERGRRQSYGPKFHIQSSLQVKTVRPTLEIPVLKELRGRDLLLVTQSLAFKTEANIVIRENSQVGQLPPGRPFPPSDHRRHILRHFPPSKQPTSLDQDRIHTQTQKQTCYLLDHQVPRISSLNFPGYAARPVPSIGGARQLLS